MASLHHHIGVLLTFSLLSGCGGDRASSGVGSDTTGAAAATRDSSTAPPAAATADTAKPPTPPAAAPSESGAKHTGTAPASGKKPAAPKTPATHETAPVATDAAKPTAADSAKTASAAPAAQQQDTSTPQADAPLRDAYHQAPHDTVSEAVYDGWKQFNLNCARCHGEDVSGTTIAPHLIVSLKPDGPINTKELFVQTVCAGRPAKGMPAWCALGLDMDKINDIYLYVKGRSDAKISPGRPAVKKEG
jgi:hypothetical protein